MGRRWRMWAVGTLLVVITSASCLGSEEVRDADLEGRTSSVDSTSSLAPTSSVTTLITIAIAPSTISTTVTTSPVAMVTAPSATTTTASRPTGVPYEGPGPRAGDQVGVVGVAFDDSLNIRRGPGVGFGIVATLPPLAAEIAVTGEARLFPSSLWYEVDQDDVIGWVNASYIALLGVTDDAASEVIAIHGSVPSADTMLALGLDVARHFAGQSQGSAIVLTVPPSLGDLGEVTYDIVGLEDDSIMGYRLHVFGLQDGGSGRYSLHSVERMSLCWRGLTEDGRCI